MLPFLKNKNHSVAGIIMKTRPADEPSEQDSETPSDDAGLEACASDLISAMQAGDAKRAAAAIRAAFEICDSQPHVEGEHLDESEEA